MSLRLGHSAICMFLPPLDLVCLTAQLSKACSEISAQLPMWATPPPTPSCLLTFNKPPGLRAPSFSSFNNWFSLKSSNTVFSGTTDIEQEASTACTPAPQAAQLPHTSPGQRAGLQEACRGVLQSSQPPRPFHPQETGLHRQEANLAPSRALHPACSHPNKALRELLRLRLG